MGATTPASHYLKMRLAVGCDQFAAANTGTQKWQQNGVPALRLSHPTRRSDSTNVLPWGDDACDLPLNDEINTLQARPEPIPALRRRVKLGGDNCTARLLKRSLELPV